MALSALAVQAEPTAVGQLGAELYPTLGHLDPELAARAEYDEWPPLES